MMLDAFAKSKKKSDGKDRKKEEERRRKKKKEEERSPRVGSVDYQPNPFMMRGDSMTINQHVSSQKSSINTF
jgi:hypothetical protein